MHPMWSFPRKQKTYKFLLLLLVQSTNFFPLDFWFSFRGYVYCWLKNLLFFLLIFRISSAVIKSFENYNQKCISDAKFRNNWNLNLAAWFLCPASPSLILCTGMICREGSTSRKMSSCKQRYGVERKQELFHPSAMSWYNLVFAGFWANRKSVPPRREKQRTQPLEKFING